LLVVESEFASTLRVLNREGNTLSPVIRNSWDTGDLNILTKNSPAKATDAHITIIGHITQQELIRYLSDTEAGNGFGNRFLWVCVTRSKCLPEGGQINEVDFIPLIQRLKEAVEFAHKSRLITFNEEARHLWHKVYPDLSEGKPGLVGAMIARAEAQVIRLSIIYALLDLSTVIRKEHLEAALAVWRYCEDSCRYIFGNALGDPVADGLLRTLRSRPDGMNRTEMNKMFKGHTKSNQIERALGLLEELGSAKREIQETGGRPSEVWFAS
jgi:DNA replicative helicase MCM subunit Mcm2 (Cdc46/Mcm family)